MPCPIKQFSFFNFKSDSKGGSVESHIFIIKYEILPYVYVWGEEGIKFTVFRRTVCQGNKAGESDYVYIHRLLFIFTPKINTLTCYALL